MKKFPGTIYVVWDGELEEEYLVANEDPVGIGDGEKVGVYELQEVKTKKVTDELV